MLNQLINTLTRKGYIIHTRPYEINIVGIRNHNNKPNSFDDTINIFYKQEDSQWIMHQCPATTDPGTYWLQTLMNRNGTAILKPGQYKNSHRIGVHRNKYQALVQQNPVTVWRDANKDNILDFNNAKEQTGLFGINIHRANSSGNTITIDKHSAGCQVFANVKDFDMLMELAHRHKRKYGNSFTYTLIESGEW